MPRGTLDPASLTRLSLTGLSPSLAGLPRTVLLGSFVDSAVRTPGCSHPGLGSSAFARRYLRNRYIFFLFLRLLRCCLLYTSTIRGCVRRNTLLYPVLIDQAFSWKILCGVAAISIIAGYINPDISRIFNPVRYHINISAVCRHRNTFCPAGLAIVQIIIINQYIMDPVSYTHLTLTTIGFSVPLYYN